MAKLGKQPSAHQSPLKGVKMIIFREVPNLYHTVSFMAGFFDFYSLSVSQEICMLWKD